jgi:nucleoside-diphosphate-sugar epimerase
MSGESQAMSSSKIFVTGASGYLGSAIAARFARAGHSVHGLTRRAEAAEALAAAGVNPVIGDLADPASYLGRLQNCDVAVHAVVDYDDAPGRDQMALDAYRTAARDGRVRKLLYTSGVWVYGPTDGEVADENRPTHPLSLVKWRVAHEDAALDLANDEVETIVFRPAMVYGESRGTIGAWFREALERRTVTYPGDGLQRWGVVHRHDVADAYVLGLEHGKAGERYNLSDENHHTVRELAEAVARAANATAQPRRASEVVEKLGAFGEALLATVLVTSAKARRELGWAPGHPAFVREADALLREFQASSETTAGL